VTVFFPTTLSSGERSFPPPEMKTAVHFSFVTISPEFFLFNLLSGFPPPFFFTLWVFPQFENVLPPSLRMSWTQDWRAPPLFFLFRIKWLSPSHLPFRAPVSRSTRTVSFFLEDYSMLQKPPKFNPLRIGVVLSSFSPSVYEFLFFFFEQDIFPCSVSLFLLLVSVGFPSLLSKELSAFFFFFRESVTKFPFLLDQTFRTNQFPFLPRRPK